MWRSTYVHRIIGPPKEHIMLLFWGEAEARVAFMPLSGIRCDCVAERERSLRDWSIKYVVQELGTSAVMTPYI